MLQQVSTASPHLCTVKVAICDVGDERKGVRLNPRSTPVVLHCLLCACWAQEACAYEQRQLYIIHVGNARLELFI